LLKIFTYFKHVSIKREGYLKYKYPSNILELHYSKPVSIYQVLEDAKISSAGVFFIKAGDLIIKEEYLLTQSTEVKLFPIIGGG
jgi:hypothetical protein